MCIDNKVSNILNLPLLEVVFVISTNGHMGCVQSIHVYFISRWYNHVLFKEHVSSEQIQTTLGIYS